MEERTVEIDGHTIPYTVRRSGRARRMRLNVTPFDGVVVVLPKHLSRWVNTDRFLLENQTWLLKHLEIAGLDPDDKGVLLDRRIAPGSKIPFHGREWVLEVQSEPSIPSVTVTLRSDDELIVVKRVPTSSLEERDALRTIVGNWLRKVATQQIEEVSKVEASRLGVTYHQVRVRGLKSKWGSCNSEGTLTFNWRLILFRPSILRYIVIHELCHLVHFDHSPEFWQLVECQDPDYNSSVEWLKSEGMNARNLLVGI